MMKNIIFFLLLIFPIVLYSQDNNLLSKYTISFNSNINFESNSLNRDFAKAFLYGQKITKKQKNQWINNSNEDNVVNFNLINSIMLEYKKDKNKFFLDISDRNIINTSFTNDFLGFIFKGNYYYQGDTLNFRNTSFRADRYQQIKIGYEREMNNFSIGTAISYLNGNHHYSYIMNEGTLYTEESGVLLDLNYEMNAFATDTSDLSLFNNNGYGFAFDFNLQYKHKDILVTLYLNDLGFIKWNQNSIIYATDSNFVFDAIHIDNFFEFNDSIIENEITDFRENITKTNDNVFKSYIPANFGISFSKDFSSSFINNVLTGFNFKWQPYMDDTLLSVKKIAQGIIESNYDPYFYLQTTSETKYLDIMSQFAYGGFTKNINTGLAIRFGKSFPITIGSNHLETIFKNRNNASVNIYLQIEKSF